jgi:hypothetical protein
MFNNFLDTHSEYVILVFIAFPLQQWLNERASILRYTYVDKMNADPEATSLSGNVFDFCCRSVSGLNFGRNTEYTDRGLFCGFPQLFQVNVRLFV